MYDRKLMPATHQVLFLLKPLLGLNVVQETSRTTTKKVTLTF